MQNPRRNTATMSVACFVRSVLLLSMQSLLASSDALSLGLLFSHMFATLINTFFGTQA